LLFESQSLTKGFFKPNLNISFINGTFSRDSYPHHVLC